MKVLITGAHFTPAVATIEELKKFKDTDIVYVGRKTTQEGDNAVSVESQVLPALGVKFIPIITGRLQRAFTIYTIPSLLKIPIGFIQSLLIILKEKPDVILSFGGYVSVPVVIVSWLFSIPIIIHEQTLISGLANKISSYFADKLAISFEKNAPSSEKIILTGNPIRREILDIPQRAASQKLPVILIIGGNQGSHVINLAVEKCLDQLLKIAVVYHQTGDSKYRDFERMQQKESDKYKIFKFISKDWSKILAGSDLIISRAGINSLTELAYLGKPALLIPIPNNEQKMNAEFFEKVGLVNILSQSKLSGDAMLSDIKIMLKNLDHIKKQASEVKKIIIPDAAKRLALETILLGKKIKV